MRTTLLVLTPVLVLATDGHAIETTAIHTNLDGYDNASVPGAGKEQFNAGNAFQLLYGSPSGARWIFKAFTDGPNDANEVLLVGSGTASATLAVREGGGSPIPGLSLGTLDTDCGINDTGAYVFGTRLVNGPAAFDETLLVFDGTQMLVAAREGGLAPGLLDPNGSGDELFGDRLDSAHVLADGTVGFRADFIQNIDPDFGSALYHGPTVVAQQGLPVLGPVFYSGFAALGTDTFRSSADGSSWIVEAELQPPVGTEAVVVNGVVEIADGDAIGSYPSPVEDINSVQMSGGGNWYARGELLNGRDWIVGNHQVLAASSEPIVPGSQEVWAQLSAVTGNLAGDHVVAGTTSTGDRVAVLNGGQVILRTGDGVDVGDGPGPSVLRIGTFGGGLVFSDDFNDDLIDDRRLFLFTTLTDTFGDPQGNGFVYVSLAECPWDCGDPDGYVDTADFLTLLDEWGDLESDCDFDGGGVGTSDFLQVIGHWGPCP